MSSQDFVVNEAEGRLSVRQTREGYILFFTETNLNQYVAQIINGRLDHEIYAEKTGYDWFNHVAHPYPKGLALPQSLVARQKIRPFLGKLPEAPRKELTDILFPAEPLVAEEPSEPKASAYQHRALKYPPRN